MGSNSVFAAEQTVKLTVPGITWGGSASRVRSTLKKINGIENVTTKVKEHVVLVTFDDEMTDTESMQKALAERSFTVEKVEVLQEEGTGM